jgi:hypothetical protein
MTLSGVVPIVARRERAVQGVSVSATIARIALAAALACTPLFADGAARASERVPGAQGPVMFVNTPGGHFAQDAPELDLTFDFTQDLRVPGRITVYVPAGFEIYPDRPAGSGVGAARIYAADYTGGATTLSLLDGDITAVTLDAAAETAAQACSPGPHIGLWNLRLSLLGKPLDLPIYLAAAGPADPAGAALRLDICPPAIDAGPVLPIEQLSVQLPELTAPATHGSYLWRALVAPLAPDRRTILAEQAYELRALVPVPHKLTLTGAYIAKTHTAQLRGSLRANGHARPGVRIKIVKLIRTITPGGYTIHDSLAGTTHTDATGAFSFRAHISRTTGFIAIAADTTNACQGTTSAPRGCLSTTIAGLESDPITISTPRA